VVSGQGNFEAMGAPVLTGNENWRTYPPSENFQPADGVNFSGEKVYEFMLVARTDENQTPGVSYSYFDPDAVKYETLTQPPLSVEARAGELKQNAAVTGSASKDGPPEPSATPATSTPTPGKPAGSSSWTLPLLNPAFLMANAALGLVWLLGFLIVAFRLAARSEGGKRRTKARITKARLAALQDCPDKEFYSRAAECMRYQLHVEDQPLEADVELESLDLDDDSKDVLLDLLARDAEGKYSFGAAATPDRNLRNRILESLKKISS